MGGGDFVGPFGVYAFAVTAGVDCQAPTGFYFAARVYLIDDAGMQRGSFYGPVTETELQAPAGPQLQIRSLQYGYEVDELRFSALVGGAPAPQTVVVCTVCGEDIGWTAASPDVTWVSTEPGGGTTGATGFYCQATVVQADASGLAAGMHDGTLRFEAPAALNAPIDIPVTLDIVQ
jgi:hypothetical protein